MSSPLSIAVLGELRVASGSLTHSLPASRKTRALRAYLALTGRPHRRERLCELFWDLPDDPRGSLRWSLSKIRGVINGQDGARLLADRERISLEVDDDTIDFRKARRLVDASLDQVPLARLHEMADALAQPLLEGLDLPNCDGYQRWLAGEREEALRLRLAVLQRITLHKETSDQEAVRWVRDWHASDPLSPEAAGILARTLKKIGRPEEGDLVAARFRRARLEAGLPPGPDLLAEPPASSEAIKVGKMLRQQTIRFCESSDGVRLAYASVGAGPAVVKAANWLNHLELDWQSPIWSKTFQALSDHRTFIRYDERGNGLSDWDVADIGFEAFVSDLETVVDAIGLESFPLIGMSQGCAVSIAYAVRHPERVTALVLIGGYAAGWRIGASSEERERREAVMTLTRLGWGTNNAAYRHIFSQTFMPDGNPEELAWFDEFQRQTTSPENAVRFQHAFGDIDVRNMLGDVRAPALVLHAQHDQRITLEQGRELAIGIPGARFVPLESRSHIVLGHEPAWTVLMREVDAFLTEHEAR
ncbi:alpha/beta hydrolase [Aliihoeflea sp. 2WW]|uniref:alpha/beta hydrolase n=1 Tax=Aliihoeflea sp. 2WW TaxID=1381123 RepID=UPI00046680F9|nr:alpha/beta hydrolase [Aliihoeflea sp. 2WW]